MGIEIYCMTDSFQALLLEEDKEERELKEGGRKSRSCLKNENKRRFAREKGDMK